MVKAMKNFKVPNAKKMKRISKQVKAGEYKKTYTRLLPLIENLIVNIYWAAQGGETCFYKDITKEKYKDYCFIEKVMNKKGYRMSVWDNHVFSDEKIPWISVEW